jgi:hypothetical protein
MLSAIEYDLSAQPRKGRRISSMASTLTNLLYHIVRLENIGSPIAPAKANGENRP